MTLGYDRPRYLLAFDHRGSFERGLFGATDAVSAEVEAGIVDAKALIFEGHLEVVKSGAVRTAGVLVDEEFGAAVARRAKASGTPLAMPVERSGQDEFELGYGEDFARHIEIFDPTFTKVLVRYNPEGDAELNRRQTHRLAQLSRWHKFLFELLAPLTTERLDRHEGQGNYDREFRPGLVVETIERMHVTDVWKIEGLDQAGDCQRVVSQARSGGREQVECIILGRGADKPKVLERLRVAAREDFDGFLEGRTIWSTRSKGSRSEMPHITK